MYLWHTNALVEDLKRGPLPETEQLKYLLFELVITALAVSIPPDTTEPLTFVSAINILLSVALVVTGTVWCYRTNVAGDNRDFVSRYLALVVPLTFRFMALVALVGFGLLLVLGRDFVSDLAAPEAPYSWVQTVLGVLMFAAFYWRLQTRIRKVSRVG